MVDDLFFKSVKPDKSLDDFVESFWMLHNPSENDMETIGLPDGRIDLFLSKSDSQPFGIVLLGIGSQPHEQAVIAAHSLIFAISFRLLAVEYFFGESISDILNSGKYLSNDFWDFNENDFKNFDSFCQKATQKIKQLLPKEIDERKRKLFELIYESNGEKSVKELSEKSFWSSRQINRYFNQQFGLSLKSYCDIMRFRASLDHIAKGKLFPELDFTDQTHFIREIKKFSGVVPKELSRNKNDRFVLLSVLKRQ